MFKQLSKIKEPGIFIKFTIAFIVVGLIPLLLISYISLTTISNQVINHTVRNYEEMLDYSSSRLMNVRDDYNNISKLMYWYNLPEFGQMKEIISNGDRFSSYKTELAIDDFLRTVINTDKYIQNVIFVPAFDEKPRVRSRNSLQFDAGNFNLYTDYREEILDNKTQLSIQSIHKDTYFRPANNYVITFTRNLLDTSNSITSDSKILGTIFVDINVQTIADIFSNLELEGDAEIYVLDANGVSLYSNQTNKLGKRINIDFDQNTISDDFLYFKKEVEELNWMVAAKVEKSSIINGIIQTRNVIHLVILVTIFSLVIVALLFSHRFSRPIYRLISLMKEVESGNMDIKMNSNRRDEIGLLASGFDKMLDNLNRYINKVYVAQIAQKQAQLNALRSQIRPHYLYNTLEVIRMSAVDSDDHAVADMIHYLSAQLKYVMEQSEDLITLDRELNHVNNYLKLIEMRYENKINFEIVIQNIELNSAHIPKLSIQPIVENAVMHGLLSKNSKGKVLVKCVGHDDNIIISVLDDGVGMNSDLEFKLKSYLKGDTDNLTPKNNGIGLKNVHERIQELFGDSFGIEISSKPSIGTMIKLKMPILGEKEHV